MLNNLRPLDILLYKERGFTNWLIQVGTSSPYSHVAVVVDPEMHLGIESNTGHQSGVRAFDLRKLQKRQVDVYRIRPVDLAKVHRQKVISSLVGRLGAGYDLRGVIGLGLLKVISLLTCGLTKKWHNNFQEKKDYFCSELCYVAFESGGVDIVPQIDDAAVTSPGDISKSPLLEKVYPLTH